jgi:hypothetical protein
VIPTIRNRCAAKHEVVRAKTADRTRAPSLDVRPLERSSDCAGRNRSRRAVNVPCRRATMPASRSDREGASGSESTRHKLPDAPTETAQRSPQSEAAPWLSHRRRGDKAACSMGASSWGRDDAAPRASCCAALDCNRCSSSLLPWLVETRARSPNAPLRRPG